MRIRRVVPCMGLFEASESFLGESTSHERIEIEIQMSFPEKVSIFIQKVLKVLKRDDYSSTICLIRDQ